MLHAMLSRYDLPDGAHIDRCRKRGGAGWWAIRRNGDCMNREGEYEYEPLPSSCDDDFLARCRFASAEEAYSTWSRFSGVVPTEQILVSDDELERVARECGFSIALRSGLGDCRVLQGSMNNLKALWECAQRQPSRPAVEVFVPDYDWNARHPSVDASVKEGVACGDYQEGDEFKMVRLTVGPCTTYKIVNGDPVPQAISFPDPAPTTASTSRII